MNLELHNFIGGIGVTMIVVSYFLVQLGRMQNPGFWYAGLNAVGAGLILYSLVFDFNLPAFIVEFFWLLISLLGLARLWVQRNRVATEPDKR